MIMECWHDGGDGPAAFDLEDCDDFAFGSIQASLLASICQMAIKLSLANPV